MALFIYIYIYMSSPSLARETLHAPLPCFHMQAGLSDVLCVQRLLRMLAH